MFPKTPLATPPISGRSTLLAGDKWVQPLNSPVTPLDTQVYQMTGSHQPVTLAEGEFPADRKAYTIINLLENYTGSSKVLL